MVLAQIANSEKFTAEVKPKLLLLPNSLAFMGVDQLKFVYSCRVFSSIRYLNGLPHRVFFRESTHSTQHRFCCDHLNAKKCIKLIMSELISSHCRSTSLQLAWWEQLWIHFFEMATTTLKKLNGLPSILSQASTF